MIIYHELLPSSYLLVLASSSTSTTENELVEYLARACRSGKPAVWVACRLLDHLSATAVGCCEPASSGYSGATRGWCRARCLPPCSRLCGGPTPVRGATS